MSGVQVSEVLAAAIERIGGQERAGQTEMAKAVQAAFQTERHLLVQAGTGTGKSLGYLVPALLHSLETGQKVVVATATLALQRQIMEHDLPAAIEAVAAATSRTPKGAVLKGRANYVCLHKTTGGYPAEASLADAAGFTSLTGSTLVGQIAAITDWAAHGGSGDRDDFRDGASPQAWSRVSTSGRECIGSNCPLVKECFAEAARAAAFGADLVVTSHAMAALQAAGNEILPPFGALVVDEAHQLVASVTSARSVTLSGPDAERLVRRVKSAGGEAAPAAAAVPHLATALEAQAAHGERGLKELDPALTEALEQLQAGAREAVSSFMDSKTMSAENRQLGGAAAEELYETAGRLLRGHGDVRWVVPGREDAPTLHGAPLDVATELREGLIGAAPTVMTSATLALGGSLEGTAKAVGFAPDEWEGLDVGSPFDYPRQAILYVAADLPAPAGAGDHYAAQHQRLAELITAAGGSTLGLFTSRAAAEQAALALRDQVDYPILLQGEATLSALVDQFKQDQRACLFGTLSLWQGIDAPGQTCRLVAIDRLAFPRPNDPLMQARQEAANRRGANGFKEIYASHAALLLAQGAGRLIRTDTDRGVVAVLDSRLAAGRKSYGRFILDSLPPMWRTESLDAVKAALTRLAAASPEPAGEPAPAASAAEE